MEGLIKLIAMLIVVSPAIWFEWNEKSIAKTVARRLFHKEVRLFGSPVRFYILREANLLQQLLFGVVLFAIFFLPMFVLGIAMVLILQAYGIE